MNKSYKHNLVHPLVHMDCHQLPKPHMGAPYVLSTSPRCPPTTTTTTRGKMQQNRDITASVLFGNPQTSLKPQIQSAQNLVDKETYEFPTY
jgi:hypothetical protein